MTALLLASAPIDGTAIGALISMILVTALVFAAIPAVLAFIILNRIPVQFRKQNPALAFLLLIPFFSLVWSFFVHPKVAQSIRAHHESKGITTNGDCGESLALWSCICMVGAIIPFLGMLSGLASLVLFILFYVKAFSLTAPTA